MKKIAIKYGLSMFVGFALFFLLMHLFGLSKNYNLRIFNGVIHFSFIYMAIQAYQQSTQGSVSNYLNGVAMGVYTSMVGVVLFTIFMLLYLAFNPGFLEMLKDGNPIGQYLTPVTASLFILVEGIVVSLIGSYVITRIIEMRIKS